jgi:hypothetical protein
VSSLFLPVSIVDDRGHRVPLARPSMVNFPRLRWGFSRRARDAPLAARIRSHDLIAKVWRDQARIPISWRQVAFYLPMLAMFPVLHFLVNPTLKWLLGELPVVVQFFVSFALVWVVLVLPTVWLIARFHAPRVRAALLAERACASCGHDLPSTPAGVDGLSTCCECGAAWRP